jgi:nicotinate dehydrogenase subunit B
MSDLTRRQFLSGGGRLLIAAAALPALSCTSSITGAVASDALASNSAGNSNQPDPAVLGTWIALDADGHVTVYFGKVDVGQGLDTAIRQLVADQLSVHPRRIHVVMGDTALTPDQGGASSASGVEMGSLPLMSVAAEVKHILLSHIAQQWQCPLSSLSVQDGEIFCDTQRSRRSSYWTLIASDALDQHWLAHMLDVSGQGNSLNVTGQATAVPLAALSADSWTGQSLARDDIHQKVTGEFVMIDQISLPDMLHARVIRPQVAGAIPLTLVLPDDMINNVFIVRRAAFAALLGEDEWRVILASRALQQTWQEPAPVFPGDSGLYDYLRNTPARMQRVALDQGAVDAVLAGTDLSSTDLLSTDLANAGAVLQAEYEWPLQSHASLGPACAVAVSNGQRMTVWSATQKPHQLRVGVSDLLGLALDKVHVIWVPGAGSYGRNDADDAGLEAAFLARETGRAVRVQYQRADATGWDPKSPAAVMRVRARLLADGSIAAMDWSALALSAHDARPSGAQASDSLIGQQLGLERPDTNNFSAPQDAYDLANRRSQWAVVPPPLRQVSPLRTSHLRDPQGPQVTFSSECFMDELAFASGQDPMAFRLRHLGDERDAQLLRALATESAWSTRPSPNPQARLQTSLPVIHSQLVGDNWRYGRGVGYCQRGRQTRVAVVSELAVDIQTGRIKLLRLVVAHDCGRVINPDGLRQTIEGAVMQACSRTLFEQVAFDERSVLSTDWFSYPILEMDSAPDQLHVVLLDRPDMPPLGAGEAAHKPVAAAIGNAMFDATAVRIRQIPLRPQVVLDALNRAQL